MGRWWHYWRRKGYEPKSRVESYPSLDCSSYYDKRKYPFVEGEEAVFYGRRLTLFSSYALFILSSQGKEYFYPIRVVTTNCHYGGHRHWFLCPLCNRRSKKLYLTYGSRFACRKCLKLAYLTQNRTDIDRITDKKWNLIRKYGGDSEWTIQKPKGMHQKTFDRIRDEIWRLDDLAEQKLMQMLGKFPLM
jgi:hypothetical protein